MAISLTHHAEIRAVERSSSVDLGHLLFRKALRALVKGEAKQYPARRDRTEIVWNGWRFITKADWRDTEGGKKHVHTLITMIKTNAFKSSTSV
jgi:hypothetical protein